MKQYLLPLLLLTITAAQAQTQANSLKAPEVNKALDARYGFLGNKFETPFSAYKGLVFVENYKGYKVYKKTNDIKSFGRAQISSIQYSFYNGVLAAVQVRANSSLANEEAWRELLKAAYGPAQDSVETKGPDDAPGQYGGNYLWSGDKAFINLGIHLADPISIYVSSSVVARRREADRKAALKRAAQKL